MFNLTRNPCVPNLLNVLRLLQINEYMKVLFYKYSGICNIPQPASSELSPKFMITQSEKPSHFLDWSTQPPSWHSNCPSLQTTSTLLVAEEPVKYEDGIPKMNQMYTGHLSSISLQTKLFHSTLPKNANCFLYVGWKHGRISGFYFSFL